MNKCTNNVGILFGHCSRIFDSLITYSTGNDSGPYSVAVADFNRDQYSDIVVTNSKTNNIILLLNNKNKTFEYGITYSTSIDSRPYAVTTSDLNNDNIIIANSGTSNIFLLYGYGDGTFENDTFYWLGYEYYPYSIAVTDLNQDNWMNIVIGCYGTDHIETLIKIC